MAQTKADFIKIPVPAGSFQTMPVDPKNRIADAEITIEFCNVEDADFMAKGLYASFPKESWVRVEPLELRPADQATRKRRLAERLRLTLSHPGMYWIKAVLVSTGEIMGVAGWMAPGQPVHYVNRRTAVDFYGYKEKMGWTDEQIEDMWAGVGPVWDEQFAATDAERADIMGDEPHWYLASIFTLPQFQGRGVGKKLLDWALKQADATDPVTPLFLESRSTVRAVYMHCGFVPQRQNSFLRRGPAIVKGLEADEHDLEKDEGKKGSVEVGEKEA